MKKFIYVLLILVHPALYAQSLDDAKTAFDAKEYAKAMRIAKQVKEAQIAKIKARNEKQKAKTKKGKQPKLKEEVAKGDTYLTLAKIYVAFVIEGGGPKDPVKGALDALDMIKKVEKENSLIYVEAFVAPLTGGQSLMDQLYGALFNKGVEAYNSSNLEVALQAFQDVDRVKPGDTTVYANIIAIANNAQNKKVVEKYVKKASEQNFRKPYFYAYLISYANADKDYDKAIRYIKEAKKYFADDENISIQEINTYLLFGKEQEAIASLEAQTKGGTNNHSIYYSLASLYDKTGRAEKAVENYKKAVEIKPDYYEAYYNWGVVYYNQYTQANKEINELIDSRGRYSNPQKGEALEKKIQDLLSKCVVPFSKAIELKKERDVMELLTRVYEVLKRTDERDALLKKLDEMDN